MNKQHSKTSYFPSRSIHTALSSFYFCPLPSSSFKMRFWKSDTIRGRPSRRDIFGSQLSKSFALLISGFLLWGSSAVFSLYSIVALGSIVSLTTYTPKRSNFIFSNMNYMNFQVILNVKGEMHHRKHNYIFIWMIYEYTNLSKLQHSELPWIAQIKRSHMLTLHQCH